MKVSTNTFVETYKHHKTIPLMDGSFLHVIIGNKVKRD
jgi:hypothetical protein